MHRRSFIRTAAMAGVGSLAGCAGGNGSGDGADAVTTTGESNPESVTVSMIDTAFDPIRASVATGGTITWENEDSFDHDVVARALTESGTDWSFDSGTIGNAGTTSYTFEESGAYEYVCTIHGEGTMCGVVLVGDPGYDATLPCESESDGAGGGMY